VRIRHTYVYMNDLKSLLSQSHQIISCILVIVVYILIASNAALVNNITFDEKNHFSFGERVLEGNTQRVDFSDDSKMPISAINAAVARLLKTDDPVIAGRFGSIILAVIAGVGVIALASQRFGKTASVVAGILFFFNPNILAHSTLVTTDLPAVFGLVVYFISLVCFTQRVGVVRSALLGEALAIAIACKYSNLLLVPLTLFFLLTLALTKTIKISFTKALIYLIVMFISTLFFVNLFWGFHKTFFTPKEVVFSTVLFNTYSSKFADLPIPLPYSFFRGIDLVMYNDASFIGRSPNYLLGKVKAGSFPEYFVVAFLLKSPLPLFILLLLGVWLFVKNRYYDQTDFFWHSIAIVYFLYFSFFLRSQIGFRFALPVSVPIFFYAASSILISKLRYVVIILLVWYVGSTVSYNPNYLAYFSEIVINKQAMFKYLGDSNIYWGQNWDRISMYINSGQVVFEPEYPVCGLVLISPDSLTGIKLNDSGLPIGSQKNRWVLQYGKLTKVIDHTHLLYEVY